MPNSIVAISSVSLPFNRFFIVILPAYVFSVSLSHLTAPAQGVYRWIWFLFCILWLYGGNAGLQAGELAADYLYQLLCGRGKHRAVTISQAEGPRGVNVLDTVIAGPLLLG